MSEWFHGSKSISLSEMMKTIQNVRIYSNNKIQTMKKNQDQLNKELKNTIILLEMQRKALQGRRQNFRT